MSNYAKTFQVKFIHNVPGDSKLAVDIWVNKKPLLTNINYKAVSSYYKLNVGIYDIDIYLAGSDPHRVDPLISYDIDFEESSSYTVIIVGDPAKLNTTLRGLVFMDSDTVPKKDKALIRFIHGSASTNVPVDIYNSVNILFKNVKYTESSDYIEVAVKAPLMVNVTPAGSNDIVLTIPTLKLAGGHSYTVVASGILNNAEFPLTAILSPESNAMCTHYL